MKTTFLKEWTPPQFKAVQTAAAKYLSSRYFETLHSGENFTPFCGCKTFRQFDAILGTAYTSTGICAGLWVCNTELYLDIKRQWKMVGFVIGSGGFVYAWFEDKNETELIFPIN